MSAKNSLHTNFIVEGKGPPVVLVHGIAGSLHQWELLTRILVASGYKVFAMDLLGHGQSAKPSSSSGYDVEAVYAHFYNWLNNIELSRSPIIFGHSLGAHISLLYALRSQRPVRGMVLINPLFTDDQLTKAAKSALKTPRLGGIIKKAAPARTMRALINVFQPEEGKLSKEIRERITTDFNTSDPKVLELPHTAKNLLPQVGRIKSPTMVMWGEQDQTLLPAKFQALADALPNNHQATIPGGHLAHISHPAEFNQTLMGFLEKIGVTVPR